MRFTISLLLLLAACSASRRVKPHRFRAGNVYEAVHELRVVQGYTTDDGDEVTRETTRSETYTDRVLGTHRAERTYHTYEVTEHFRFGATEEQTTLDPTVVGEPLGLVRDGHIWRPLPGEERTVPDTTQVGPPRFWSGTSEKWRTFGDTPLLLFLGLGRFESGTLRARRAEYGTHQGYPTVQVALEAEERYERATVTARGWMIFDVEWGMVGKLVLDGRITPSKGRPERFKATRTWSPAEQGR